MTESRQPLVPTFLPVKREIDSMMRPGPHSPFTEATRRAMQERNMVLSGAGEEGECLLGLGSLPKLLASPPTEFVGNKPPQQKDDNMHPIVGSGAQALGKRRKASLRKDLCSEMQ